MNKIDCELANFGSVPYGTKTIGELYLANPINACNRTEIVKSNSTEEIPTIHFLLAVRGGCAFADKVYNA